MKHLTTDFGLTKDGIPEFSKIETSGHGLKTVRGLMRSVRMAKGGGDRPPPAPDPTATAQAQATANKDTAIAQQHMNLINQYTPYGVNPFFS